MRNPSTLEDLMLTIEVFNRIRYDNKTGLFLRKRVSGQFKPVKMKPWRDRNGNYYNVIGVLNKVFKAHRVAWLLHYGAWPNGDIDHIDGNGLNNRIENLRCVTVAENCKNSKRRKTNTSGQMGVCWHSRDNTWQARICVDSKYIHLGYFNTLEEAVSARKSAEQQYGFHENHGR